MGRPLPTFNATSANFTITTPVVEEPIRLEGTVEPSLCEKLPSPPADLSDSFATTVTPTVADGILLLTWGSAIAGPAMVVSGALLLSSQVIFLSKPGRSIVSAL